MKTLKQLSIVLCMALAVLSCNKDDDDNASAGGGGGGDESFTASVDGAAFAADTDLATLIGGSLTSSGGQMVLVGQGSTNNGDFINFSIVNYNGTGTYTTGDALSNANSIQYGEVAGQSAVIWGSNLATAVLGTLRAGEIVVTVQDDTHAEGTFSFEGYNSADMSTKNVTSGAFNIVFDN